MSGPVRTVEAPSESGGVGTKRSRDAAATEPAASIPIAPGTYPRHVAAERRDARRNRSSTRGLLRAARPMDAAITTSLSTVVKPRPRA
ncbi:hypothetical protein ACFPRL_11425 [Pseudoclavibacter helvolus]